MKNALVISGGGAKGAFAVGAIEVLREKQISFDIVSGTSTGALIAPLAVTDEIQLLRSVYTGVETDDIVKLRNIIDILTTDSIYDSTPLWELINSLIPEERYQKIIQSPTEMIVTTVDLQSGGLVYWNQHTSGPNGGPMQRRELLRAVFASGSMPVLMPPVQIDNSDDQHVDGGVREIAPLSVAIDHGATDIYAIVLSPEIRERKDEKYVFVGKTLLRTIDIFTQEIVVNDVARAEQVNAAVRHLAALRRKAEAMLTPAQVAEIFDAPDLENPFAEKRVMNITTIRPEEELPLDALEFDRVRMSELVEMGRVAAEQALQAGARRMT